MAKTDKSNKESADTKSGDNGKDKQLNADWDKRSKEKEKQFKEREVRKKKREKKEMQRIKSNVNFPIKALFQGSIIIGLIFFVVKYFGQSADLIKSIFYSFIVFASVYIGVGIIMLLSFFLIAHNKKRELREMIKVEKERKMQEEEQRRADEHKRAEEAARLEEQLNQELKEELRRQESAKANNAARARNQQSADVNNQMPGNALNDMLFEDEMNI
jgi:flagellar biosynthesis/type III secretory pathway M-ring protein FliF/YscJ